MQVYQLSILSIIADHVCVCMHACMYVCIYVCMYICIHVCMYVCMHACYVCICMHACMHVCVCVCMYVCIYVCMYYVRTYVIMYACVYVCTLLQKGITKDTKQTNCQNNIEQIQMLFQVARQSYSTIIFDMNDILLGTGCHFLYCLIFISKRNNT